MTLHDAETLVASETPNISGGGIALSIDLTGDADGLVGYRGKHHTGLVDVDKRAAHDVLDFWEPLYNRQRRRRTGARSRRVLHPGVARGGACAARSTPPR